MSQIPRDKSLDSTLALLREGYTFVSRRCQRYQSDLFETRLMLREAVFMMGEEAARIFYHAGRFTRKGALPVTTRKLLQDEGSLQLMDGEAHHWRKRMFMSLMTPERIARLRDATADQWRASLRRWEATDQVVLHHEVEEILCRAVCVWAGVPLSESEAKQRTREFRGMIDGAGAFGPRNWWGMLLRARTDRWIRGIIERVRTGKLDVPEGSAANVIAWHRELSGELLDAEVAAAELLDVLRPTVAVARFVTFAALALHEHQDARQRLQAGDNDYLELFVHEVRRFYPFIPFVAGRVQKEFGWRGHHFAKGTWVLLDLYGTNHDARIWDEPEAFRPERFRRWDGSAFNFIPQGAGDHYDDHRCPGEWITTELMKVAVGLLTKSMKYDVSKQDLRISLSRIPAIPKSRFVISNVRRIQQFCNSDGGVPSLGFCRSALQLEGGLEMSTKQIDFRVGKLDCESEAAAIERGLKGSPGLVELKVYPKSAKVALSYDPGVTTPESFKDRLNALGFPVQEGRAMASQPKPWRNPKVLTSVASGALLLIGFLIGYSGVSDTTQFVIYIAAILIGGYYFGREAIEELIFEQEVGIELLMSIAAVAATVMGEAGEGAMLVFLYSISEAAEGYTEEKTRSAIKALMDLTPKQALVRREDREVEIPVEELIVGDVFIVKPGQSLATDGEVIAGGSSVNQAPITGESVPVEKAVGDTVFAGSINGEGSLEIRAMKAFADNTIARIIHMVEEAQEQKGKSQRFIELFGRRYSPAVLLVGIMIAVVAPVSFDASWTDWITRAIVFIVAAAPCALAISIPITLVATLGTGARQGVLIKGGLYVEELAKVRVVALDKTGTITRGEPEVTDVLPLSDEKRPYEMLSVAAGVERRSQHPLAQAIIRHAEALRILPAEVNEFRSLTGAGASATVNGQVIYVGSPDLFETKLGLSLAGVKDEITRLQTEGKSVIVVGDPSAAWGLIAIRDQIRPNAGKAIQALHRVGIQKVVMLTGDNERTARTIASEVGIDDVYADLKPEDKVEKVRELSQRFGHVAMVGDGVNDAPALAAATVGIAMGAAGTDVALETADVALMADDLEKLVYALHLARRNQRVVNQNLALSAVVIGVLVIGAVAGVFSLPIAVLGHEISEFVVIGSGLRMLRA